MGNKMTRPVSVNTAIDGTVQRPLGTYSAAVNCDFIYVDLDASASSPIYVGWSQTDGTKPSSITNATKVKAVQPGQQIKFEDETKSYARLDFRHLCFQGDAADSANYVTLTYHEPADAVEPK